MDNLDNINYGKRYLVKGKRGLSEKLPAHTISTWFEPINPIALENDELVLEVPSQFL